MSRYRRFSQGRSRGQQSGDQVAFCCVDFSLDELKGDKSWRLNRKPIESTLVACFMTLVIIVWSVAALIWPVPIIAGFLPNGMEGTVVSIRNYSQTQGCMVCTGSGNSAQCNTSLLLRNATPVSVDFSCSRPQDVFIKTDAGSIPFLAFDRKFTWNLKASPPNAFRINFASVGLRQINALERCPDRHSYTLQAFQTTGEVVVGTFCRVGRISSAQILNQGGFSLDVPAGQKLQSGQFDVSVGEEIKSLAKITVTLPKGTSSSELLSPNYPDSFPDDDVMDWYFQVPDKHKVSVQVLKLSQPLCLKKETALEYHSRATEASVRRLTDPQPDQSQGNFSLTLRNCEMDRRRSGSPGLSVSLNVSSSSQSSSGLCIICAQGLEVSKMKVASLRIKKLRPTSDCEMKMNSVQKEEITVTSTADFLFSDFNGLCLFMSECRQLKDCPKTPVLLEVPELPSCFPAALSSVTWTLSPPQHGTVELTSTAGHLKQSLPGQPCSDSIMIEVAEHDGTIGHFCTQGAIQKIQVHTNVSVTVSGMAGKALKSFFFTSYAERYIFTVSPKKDTPVLLASPGWPVGMQDYATISWIISIPEKMEAHLMFANLSQPKCSNRHTNIKVKRIGSLEEDYSRREDEEAESEITVPESFYLNMSNCMPERGSFSVITKVTLQKSINLLLIIILSVVAVLFFLFVIVLVVVKKKKKLSHQVSIYNPNGTVFLPGNNGLPGARDDNDEHEYASIEDTLVYTHLLRKGREIGVYGEFDTYRPFTGCTESHKPLVSKDSSSDNTHGSKQQFQGSSQKPPPLPVRSLSHDKSLVDNVIYQAEGQSEEEHSPTLGPRLEPEGGN
uniref:Uncharacterized protein n=1 Tax=Mola mola TaxID=94237 RepID=A0A3Q3WHI0_MOLML